MSRSEYNRMIAAQRKRRTEAKEAERREKRNLTLTVCGLAFTMSQVMMLVWWFR